MIYAILLSLLFVGSNAAASCGPGLDDRNDTGNCEACADGSWKGDTTTNDCDVWTSDPCSTAGIGGSTAIVPGSATTNNVCGCAAGHAGAACAECDDGTTFSAGITLTTTACEAVTACGDVSQVVIATSTSADRTCGCADGKGIDSDGTTCVNCVPEQNFSTGPTGLTVECGAVATCDGTTVTLTLGLANANRVCGCDTGKGKGASDPCEPCGASTFSDAVTALSAVCADKTNTLAATCTTNNRALVGDSKTSDDSACAATCLPNYEISQGGGNGTAALEACVNCTAGHGGATCQPCDNGKFSEGAAVAVECTLKTKTTDSCAALKRVLDTAGVDATKNTDDSLCGICTDNYEIAADQGNGVNTTVPCLFCKKGFGGAACEVCAAGTFKAASTPATSNTPCGAKGTVKATCDALKRAYVPGLTTADDGSCATACDANHEISKGGGNGNGEACVNCTAGHGGAGCQPCANGSFSEGALIATGCTPKTKTTDTCAALKRVLGNAGSDATKNSDDSACGICTANYEVSADGGDGDDTTVPCTFCQKGFGGAACQVCPAGTFKAASVADATECGAKGTVKATCDALKRAYEAGLTTADDGACSNSCDAGFAIAADANAGPTIACDHCAAGFGGAACEVCATGTHSAAIAAAGTACTADTACDDTAKFPARDGVVLHGGSTTADDATCQCKPGFGGNKCEACGAGKFSKTQTAKETGCTDHTTTATLACDAEKKQEVIAGTTTADAYCGCPAGKGTTTAAATTCAACAAGTFSAEATPATAAGVCSDKIDCNAGRDGTENQKTAETPSTDAVCKECGANKHSTDLGKTCEDNTQCDASFSTSPFIVIPASKITDAICGCADGYYAANCGADCGADKFLAAGANLAKTAADCTAHSTCKGAGEFGVKTAGTRGKDAECNATASSAAAVVFSALTLFAMLL